MSNLIASGSRLTPARLGAVWQSYTPTWTATTNPAIGNGTITAKYRQFSSTVEVAARILMGSTTTYGTGAWRFSLPVTAANATIGAGAGWTYDASTVGNRKPMIVWLATASSVGMQGDTGDVDATNPFGWASGDQVRFTFTYEAVV